MRRAMTDSMGMTGARQPLALHPNLGFDVHDPHGGGQAQSPNQMLNFNAIGQLPAHGYASSSVAPSRAFGTPENAINGTVQPTSSQPFLGMRLTYYRTGVKVGNNWVHCPCGPATRATYHLSKKAGPNFNKPFLRCKHFGKRCNWFAWPHREPGKVLRRALGLDQLTKVQRQLFWESA